MRTAKSLTLLFTFTALLLTLSFTHASDLESLPGQKISSSSNVKLDSESSSTNETEIPNSESSDQIPIQTIDKKFLGTWRLEKSENFEEFLKELGKYQNKKKLSRSWMTFN